MDQTLAQSRRATPAQAGSESFPTFQGGAEWGPPSERAGVSNTPGNKGCRFLVTHNRLRFLVWGTEGGCQESGVCSELRGRVTWGALPSRLHTRRRGRRRVIEPWGCLSLPPRVNFVRPGLFYNVLIRILSGQSPPSPVFKPPP